MAAAAVPVNAMLRAAETGDVAAVKSSIEGGVDVLSKDGASNTAVCASCLDVCPLIWIRGLDWTVLSASVLVTA